MSKIREEAAKKRLRAENEAHNLNEVWIFLLIESRRPLRTMFNASSDRFEIVAKDENRTHQSKVLIYLIHKSIFISRFNAFFQLIMKLCSC